MKELVEDSVGALARVLNSLEKGFSFEVLGYDFMVDEDFRVWLIEVNTNPCLELCSASLARLIPCVLDNSFRIALDPLFPAPETSKKFNQWSKRKFFN